ncbi:MAG: hypothetical protein EBV73_04115, partial [Rhodocyclales bacterium]|nr:hypothetical protein [Rhodocyclales bacterium]
MNTLLWSILVAIGLVEFLRLDFHLNFWRQRADAIEQAALSFSEAPNDQAQQSILLRAAWNLIALVLFAWGILAVIFFNLLVLPDLAHIDEHIYFWAASFWFMGYAWLRSHWLTASNQTTSISHPAQSYQTQNTYNRTARWLHWMALDIGLVTKTSFELEKAIFLKKAQLNKNIIDRPVYVMGLARSGTTIILEILEKTGAFHSPTYRDMPFILCPNLWSRLSRFSRLDTQLATRAHGDGLLVGFDSPESFEEVFWRTSCTELNGTGLSYTIPDHEVMADFAAYRQLSVHSASPSQPQRYLSKNNNNLLRLTQLSSAPNAKLVLVIRDPIDTAWSLYRQHFRFSQMQADDPFIRAYMRWLGHHEFGQHHKPLGIGLQYLKQLEPSQPDYWLAYWIGIHEHIWQILRSMHNDNLSRINIIFYEDLSYSINSELSKLFKKLNINTSKTYRDIEKS